MANNTNLKPFKKGFDPRRNLKGVPKDAVLFRKHLRKIAAEIVGGDDSGMTRLDAALRLAMSSKNPAHLKIIIQTLYPEVLRDNVDVTSGGEKLQTDPANMKPSEIAERVAAILAATKAKDGSDG